MELFKILGTIAVDNGKANEAINQTGEHAGHLSEKLGKAFSNAGKFAVAAGKTIATGLAAGSAAMGKLIQASVDSYADYEQLVGGVETLFKNSSAKVMEYADRAYETAGLSANDYMETVTGFSASLLQSMGNNTARAAEIADMAILDMADNANKMGTDMSSIQNAYQGFAKQNYTMLDNLKLGYGGTQQEMKRLLKDAQKLTGIKYNISNLADVYSAIHVIQQELGVTGTTAKEASETISGSFSAMKASWANLLNGVAGAGDLNKLIDSFVKTSKTYVGNLTKLMPNLVKGVTGLIQGLAPQLPGMLEGILPGLLDGAVSLLSGLAMALPGLLDIITAEFPSIIRQLAGAFEQVFPVLAQSIGNLFTSLVNNLPQLLQSIGSVIQSVWVNGIWPGVQGAFKAVFGVEVPEWSEVTNTVSGWWNGTARPKIEEFLKAKFNIDVSEFDSLPEIAEKVKGAFEGVKTAIEDFVGWLNSGELSATAFKDAITGIVAAIATFKAALTVQQITSFVASIFSANGAIGKLWALLSAHPIAAVIAAFVGLCVAINNATQNIDKLLIKLGLVSNKTIEFNGIHIRMPDPGATVDECVAWFNKLDPELVKEWELEPPPENGTAEEMQTWWEGVKSKLDLHAEATVKITQTGGFTIQPEGTGEAVEFEKRSIKELLQTDSSVYKKGVQNLFKSLIGHKTGLDFVPRDNYLARLHQGEAVLTADEARDWRNGRSGQQEVYHEEAIITGNNFYIQQESDIYDLAVELSSLRRESRRGRGARN